MGVIGRHVYAIEDSEIIPPALKLLYISFVIVIIGCVFSKDIFRFYPTAHRDQDLDEDADMVHHCRDEYYHVALCLYVSGSMQAGGGTLEC